MHHRHYKLLTIKTLRSGRKIILIFAASVNFCRAGSSKLVSGFSLFRSPPLLPGRNPVPPSRNVLPDGSSLSRRVFFSARNRVREWSCFDPKRLRGAAVKLIDNAEINVGNCIQRVKYFRRQIASLFANFFAKALNFAPKPPSKAVSGYSLSRSPPLLPRRNARPPQAGARCPTALPEPPGFFWPGRSVLRPGAVPTTTE